MAVLNSVLRLSLLDQVSGRAKIINSSLNSIRATQSALIGTFGRVAAFGAAYLGVSQGISGSVGAARDMQAALTEVGIKAGLSNDALTVMQRRLTALSGPTNQMTADLVAAVDVMVGMGLAADDAVGAVGAVGKAATATGATIADLSSATVSVMQNLKVPADQMTAALDAMASAGNNGAFELKAMAQYIPSLGAAYQAFGQKGVGAVADLASALQIVRTGTGDESTAANALANLLQKLNAPQTRTAFKKMGVNLGKQMERATAKGMTPIEAIAEITNETLKGDLSKMGDLFADSEVQRALRPLLQNMAEYRRIRDEANRADGTVADAFARRMEEANQKIRALQIRLQNAGMIIGAKLLEPIAKVADYFSDIFDTADRRVTVFDRLTSAVKGFVAGLGFDGSDGLKSLGDMIFGIAGKDGTAAGEELGRIAYKFRQFGESVKKVADAVKDSPIASFMTELAAAIGALAMSKWARLFIVAWGIAALIDAVKDAGSIGEFVDQLKNLSAMEWAGIGVGFILVASKVRKLVNAFRDLAKVTPKSLPGTPGKPPAGGAPPAAGGSALGAIAKRIAGIVGLGYMSYEGAKTITSPSDELTNAPRQKWGVDDALRSLWRSFNTTGGNPYASEAEAARQQQQGLNVFSGVGQRLGVDQPVKIDASSIGALTKPTAEQPVRVMNPPPPPNISITNSFVINEATNGKALADQATQGLDKALRDAAEGSYRYGAY